MPIPVKDYKKQGIIRVAGSGTAAQIAAIPSGGKCSWVRIAPMPSNAGTAFIGFSSGVTTANGYGLAAGDTLELFIPNTNLLWHIGSDGSQPLQIVWQD